MSQRDKASAQEVRDYFGWQKALLRSGNVQVTRAADAALLVVTYGWLGHRCRPEVQTMAEASGQSLSTMGKKLKTLRAHGYLRAKTWHRKPTTYCIAPVADSMLLEPVSDGPCPRCYPAADASILSSSSQRPSETTDQHVLLTEETAADGTLSESVSSQALDLAALLDQHNPDRWSDQDLLLYAQLIDPHTGQRSSTDLIKITKAISQKGIRISAASVNGFVAAQPVSKPRPSAKQKRLQKAIADSEARDADARARAERRRQLGISPVDDPWDMF